MRKVSRYVGSFYCSGVALDQVATYSNNISCRMHGTKLATMNRRRAMRGPHPEYFSKVQ